LNKDFILAITNVLVYRFDGRFADKQKIATQILRRGILEDSVRVPHQAIVEFVAAVTRPLVDAIFEALRSIRPGQIVRIPRGVPTGANPA
jgi:hypothetical protein